MVVGKKSAQELWKSWNERDRGGDSLGWLQPFPDSEMEALCEGRRQRAKGQGAGVVQRLWTAEEKQENRTISVAEGA